MMAGARYHRAITHREIDMARKGISAARADRTRFLERAAAFRRKLSGRRHSDSTTLIRKDRDR
jgi:hypothetical protein